MNVVINGEPREIPEGLSVAALLDHLNMKPDRVAIELNREIVPRAQWDATLVQPNDSFEIVHFVGGGSDPARVGVLFAPRAPVVAGAAEGSESASADQSRGR